MSQPSEYLATAAVLALRDTKLSDLPGDRAGLGKLLVERYGISIDERGMQLLLDQLASWSMVSKIDDDFAGETLQFKGAKSDTAWEKAETEVLDKAWEGGRQWLRKVFSNDDFWRQLDGQAPLSADNQSDDLGGPIPAADRIVTLSHNQYAAISPVVDEVVDVVERDNGDPDSPGLRQIILGQIKAGRELLRAGVFNAHIFYLTMISGLQILVDRYGESALGEVAKKLLDVIAEHMSDLIF